MLLSVALAVSGIHRAATDDEPEAIAQSLSLPDSTYSNMAEPAGSDQVVEIKPVMPEEATPAEKSVRAAVTPPTAKEQPAPPMTTYEVKEEQISASAAPVVPAEPKAIVEPRRGFIDATPVAVPIPGVIRSVEWRESRSDKRIKIAGLKGYVVEEADTARRVWLHTTRGWLDAMRLQTRGEILTIDMNFDKFAPLLDDHHTIRTPHYTAGILVVPRGMLRSASVGHRTLYIKMFRTKTFDATSEDRIVLYHSEIGNLNSMSNSLSELKLDYSTVGMADIYRVRNRFIVECTSKASRVDTLYIEGVRVGRFASIDLEKANVGQLKWNPADRGVSVRILSSVPVNAILPPTKSSRSR